MFTVEMVKTPDQMRNMIEDWIKITGLKYHDTTIKIQEKNPNIEWQLLLDPAMHITKMKKRNDRILFHLAMGFEEKIIDEMQKLGDQEKVDLFNGINEMISLAGLTYNWIVKDKLRAGINVRDYIDEEELNRPNVFKTLDKISLMGTLVLSRIAMRINPTGVKTTDVGKASDKQMYT